MFFDGNMTDALMKIALAQTNPIIGDFDHNIARLTYFAGQAAQRHCDLVVFSELAVSGYPPRDLLERQDFIAANLAALKTLTDSIQGIGVICGVIDTNPEDKGLPLYNAAVLFEDGQVLHKVHKQLLPTYDIFDERRYFAPGQTGAPYLYKGRRIGLTVCEDAWNDPEIFKPRKYPIDPVAELVRAGADLIINVSASPFFVGHNALRQHIFKTMARKYGLPVVYTNQVGGNDSVLFDGLSSAYDQDGRLAAQASDFEEDLVVFDTQAPDRTAEIHRSSGSEIESVVRALAMGTRDYVTKCGFSKVVVGLSGGIDSALTAAIAVMALGRENVSGVFMPSPYTARENYEDTAQLAQNLGIARQQIPIDSIFKAFLAMVSPQFKAEDPGIAEQNIQARIRGTLLMALSNKLGSLVLSTGNKSELAVGYCTLYGDMNGGLAVISDVPKTMVYDLARWINRQKPVIPQRILDKVPSAELKPDQADQDDLPPYETLDTILKAYIEDFKGPHELTAMGFEPRMVADVIGKVERSEYKRLQAAPGLKVTSKSFGYGRRYPLAQRYSAAAKLNK